MTAIRSQLSSDQTSYYSSELWQERDGLHVQFRPHGLTMPDGTSYPQALKAAKEAVQTDKDALNTLRNEAGTHANSTINGSGWRED